MNPQADLPSVDIPLLVVTLAIVIIAIIIFFTLRKARKTGERPQPQGTEPSSTALSRVLVAGGMQLSFSRGLRFLKEHVAGRNFLYDVPWLMMLGPADSGTSTVLANAASSSSLAQWGGRTFGLAGGLEWWFYQRGLVLNPPSDTVLRSDGTSDRANWHALLQLLARKRARRPLDAVVLALSAGDLLENPNSANPGELTSRADVLRQKLSQLRRGASMRMPVYVLVTKCDLIPGFTSFASELPAVLQADMFGWSNPYPLDEAFSPDWVDQCCAEMRRRIMEQQIELFVERERLREPDGVFLFPAQFQMLQAPLRRYLAQIFQTTAYEESYYFRGIYFCGDATNVAEVTQPEPAMAMVAAAGAAAGVADRFSSEETSLIPASSGVSHLPVCVRDEVPRPVFLNHLFERKIFPECRLAKPLSVIDMSRNRVVLTAKVLTAIFVVVAVIGTLAAYVRFSNLTQNHLAPLFDGIVKDMHNDLFTKTQAGQESAGETKARNEWESRNTRGVLQSMSLLADNRLRSVFIPATWTGVGGHPLQWTGNVDHDLQAALSKAFGSIVLQGLQVELTLRLKKLILDTSPNPFNAADNAEPTANADTTFVHLAEPIYQSPASVPQYHAWEQYIAGLRELETNIARYNRIATPGEGGVNDLKDLLKYLKLDAELPQDFDFNNPYFLAMLTQATNRRFDFTKNRRDAVDHAHSLVSGFFDALFGPRNHLLLACDKMVVDINHVVETINDFPRSAVAVRYEALKDTADSIGHVSGDLANPAFAWISDGDFNAQRFPAFTQPISDIQYLQGFQLKNDMDQFGREGYLNFLDALAGKTTKLTGQVVDLDSPPAQVTSSVATLHANLQVLLEQSFVARDPGPRKTLEQAPIWDRNTLLDADKLFDAYDKYERGSLRTAPPMVRVALRQVALERLQDNALDLVGQAQSAVLPTSPEGAELQNFVQSMDVLQHVSAGFGKFPNQQQTQNFNTLLVGQAAHLLLTLDGQLKEKNLYAVKNQNFDWWEGEKPLSLAAYDERTPDDLKDYTDHELAQVTSMSQQADPLVKFLDQRRTGKDSVQTQGEWRLIAQELKKHTEKTPGNSVTLLEDFVRTGMDKIAPDTSCVDTTRDPPGRSDYFIEMRSQLRSGVVQRCRILSQRAYTTQIAGTFDRRLAGRFPFAQAQPQNPVTEADPKALVEFFAKFDQFGKIAIDSLNQSPQYGKSRDAALSFLGDMTEIRKVFSAYLAGVEKDPSPSFDFIVNFRANQGREVRGNQISDWSLDVGQQSFRYRAKENTGRWRLGDPVRVSFRFADDSPLIPVVDPAQHGMSVQQKRTVSFDYTGSWSLLRLLLAHKTNLADFDKGADPSPHTLTFLIPTAPDRTLPPQTKDDTGAGQVQVYLQITLIPPGAKDRVSVPLPFPVLAPALTEKQ
jgi:type VI secretion system protein ImpL